MAAPRFSFRQSRLRLAARARISASGHPAGVCFGKERRLPRHAIAAIGPKRGDVVLDLACGTGVNLPHFVAVVGPSSRVVAVDYSEGMLNAAQRKAEANAWSNIEFRQTDGACLELPEASLEGAICTFGLSAMSDESAS